MERTKIQVNSTFSWQRNNLCDFWHVAVNYLFGGEDGDVVFVNESGLFLDQFGLGFFPGKTEVN